MSGVSRSVIPDSLKVTNVRAQWGAMPFMALSAALICKMKTIHSAKKQRIGSDKWSLNHKQHCIIFVYTLFYNKLYIFIALCYFEHKYTNTCIEVASEHDDMNILSQYLLSRGSGPFFSYSILHHVLVFFMHPSVSSFCKNLVSHRALVPPSLHLALLLLKWSSNE